MINWIIGGFIILWLFVSRIINKRKVPEYPLGLPRGSVRALTTILVVAFPFYFLFEGKPIPGLIINAIFILVAFYFEARKSPKEKMEKIISEIKMTGELEHIETEKQIYPLYLPKYSVRISLFTILILILVINFFGPNVEFTYTNTILDIVIIIVLYIIGTFFRTIKNRREEKNIKQRIKNLKDYRNLSDVEIIEQLMKKETKKWKLTGKGIFSILMFSAIATSLIMYQISFDIPIYTFSLRESLLLLVNVYYGFRD
ncbi:MAG: hypothetical protein GF311_18385 [Candidatus Lokiarchaeota archaeon]|nr:hypothetical protein [Candidatus Lokiarchaeota archaeon]